MEIVNLIQKFSGSKENQSKAIFSTLFIAGNRLQTLFDRQIPEITLKQFMLLTMVKQSKEQLTFTELGELLGCSRQNIKKLAFALQQNGFVEIRQSENDIRASSICPTEKMKNYFETIFVSYERQLHYLFEIYSEEEISQLFQLFMKLYEGIDHLEQGMKREQMIERK